MFRGNSPAKIDDKGRLKVPSAFRALIEQQGRGLFVTSLHGDCVRIYPISEWTRIEERVAALPSTLPARAKFLNRVNYYGQVAELDSQGRVLIQPLLRESAAMNGEVDVIGSAEHLELWNHERFMAKLEREPLTDEDLAVLAQHGI